MTIMDALLELSDAQAITTQQANTSENIIDLQAANLAIGAGTPLFLNVRVNTAFDSPADALTLAVAFCTDSVAAFSSPTTIITTPALAQGSIDADGDWILRCGIPYEALEQYIGCLYTIASATASAGAIDAWIGIGRPMQHNI